MDDNNFTKPVGNTSLGENSFDSTTEAVASFLTKYFTPLLVCMGSVGNILSIYVFLSSNLKFHSTSLYLSALALSDTLFLLQLIPPWLSAIQSAAFFYQPGFCQLFVYTSYTSCFLSAWLVVAFTVERFVAVVYPLQRHSMCTMSRAKNIIVLLVLVALVLNIPVIKFSSSATDDCNIASEYVEQAANFNIVDTALSFTVPLAIIIFLNACIMSGVYRIEKARNEFMVVEEEEVQVVEGRARSPLPPPPPPPRSQHRVTRMLLIVSSVFVLLNLPAYTMRILAYAYDMRAKEYTGRWAALQQLALMFFHTNFGINFILYCLSGQNFRRALYLNLPCLRRTQRNDDIPLVSINSDRASITPPYGSGRDPTISRAEALGLLPRSTLRRHLSEPYIYRGPVDNIRHWSEPDINCGRVGSNSYYSERNIQHSSFNNSPEHAQDSPADLPIVDSEPSVSLTDDDTLTSCVVQRAFPFLFFPYNNLFIVRGDGETSTHGSRSVSRNGSVGK